MRELVLKTVRFLYPLHAATGFAVHRNGGCVSPTCRLLGVWGGKGWFSFYHPLGKPDVRARECAGSRPQLAAAASCCFRRTHAAR